MLYILEVINLLLIGFLYYKNYKPVKINGPDIKVMVKKLPITFKASLSPAPTSIINEPIEQPINRLQRRSSYNTPRQ
jgi:hypothetical protein